MKQPILKVAAHVFLLLSISTPSVWAAETTRVSVDSNGVQGNDSSSELPSISADGRYVVFSSFSTNLIAGETNGTAGIFVHDGLTNTTSRVNVTSEGTPATFLGSTITHPQSSISADGRYVAFVAIANTLIPGSSNNIDVFVHDRLTKTTNRVSINSNGAQGKGNSHYPSLSADGRFVTFWSDTNNLVVGDTNKLPDVFVHDRLNKTTRRVSTGSEGVQANGSTSSGFYSSISADGRYIVFSSSANNLVAEDTNNSNDIFVNDTLTKITSRVNVDSNGLQANSGADNPSISADGRYVVFQSNASNLVAGDTNNKTDIFVHDRLTKTTDRVSVNSNGLEDIGSTLGSFNPSVSANGRYVVFHSYDSNLVTGDANGKTDVFLHDRVTKTTRLVSRNNNGLQGNGSSANASISANGHFVAFASSASNLVSGDTNDITDNFTYELKKITTSRADLAVTVSQQPSSLAANGIGHFNLTVTNNGEDVVDAIQLTHAVSNGTITALTPSQGHCKSYSAISLCTFTSGLQVGQSATLTVDVKATGGDLSQSISINNGSSTDPVKTNNYLKLTTPVIP